MMQQAVNSSVDAQVKTEKHYLEQSNHDGPTSSAASATREPQAVEKNAQDEILKQFSLNRSMKQKEVSLTSDESSLMSMKKKRSTASTSSNKVVPLPVTEETEEELKSAIDQKREEKMQTLVRRLSTMKNLDSKEIQKVAKEVDRTVQQSQRTNQTKVKFLVSPNSPLRNKFDLIVILALAFVALVTPFEVSFIPEEMHNQGLFVINKLIDTTFAIDIFLNFLTPIQVNGNWVMSHRVIAYHYMKSWFIVDLASVLPFEMLKMVRLVRLTKLLRIFRASRVLKRWETRLSISYGYITLTKYIWSMLLLSHWLACLFRLVPTFENGETSWLQGYFEGNLGVPMEDVTMLYEYNAALYWAVMTVTTIGYGDVIPKTDAERWVAIVAMILGGSAYAYIVGSVCGLVASMGELKTILHRKIDDLNVYMEEAKLPSDLRVALREYFHYTAKATQQSHYDQLLAEMSPGMRADIFFRINAKIVEKTPFADVASSFERKAFVTTLAERLKLNIYPPKERICAPGSISKELYIIEKGIVMMNKSYFTPPELNDQLDSDAPYIDLSNTLGATEKKILTRGKCFGEDFVLTNARRRYHCMTFTYVELHTLSREDLFDAFSDDTFPETWRNFRKYVIKCAFRQKFVHVAKIIESKRKAMEREAESQGLSEQELDQRRDTLKSQIVTSMASTSSFDRRSVSSTDPSSVVSRQEFDHLAQELAEIKALLLKKF